jgi:hypothetical protein
MIMLAYEGDKGNRGCVKHQDTFEAIRFIQFMSVVLGSRLPTPSQRKVPERFFHFFGRWYVRGTLFYRWYSTKKENSSTNSFG